MAAVNLDTSNTFKVKIGKFTDAFDGIAVVSVDGTDGAVFTLDGKDTDAILYIKNKHATDAKSVTIKAGNGIQGVNDISLSLAAGKFTLIRLESGIFKNVSGTNKGKVKITGASTDIQCAVIKLV